MAAWGNLLGAPATGRYMQLFALGASAAVVWSFGRRFGSLGPLAAVIVATTPALFWQATTAYDDLLLAIATFALTVAVFEALQPQFGMSDRATGLALGLMAGTGASLKTYLVPICGALVLGWILSARRPADIVRRLAYGLIGVFITAAPALALRWIDTGNPVFPAYNNIFKSPYWLPVNEHLNFPFWPHPGSWGPVKAVWDALFHPTVTVEATPPGAYGLLIGALVTALLIGWRLRRRASLLLWGAIVLATGFWWVEFRYLRYLLPEGFAALVLLLVALPPGRMALARPRLLVSAVAVVAATSFAVTVAQLWNVPNRRLPISAAIGHWSASDYLLAALPERQALLAFNRLAPPGARVVTDAFERDWLTRGRDLFGTWELTDLMQLHGPLPTSGDGAYARARAMGVDVGLVQLLAFAVSAAYAGLAGGLYAQFLSYISPETFAFPQTLSVLTMTLVGGLGTMIGPILGAITLTVLSESLRALEKFQLVIFGAMLLLTVLFLPTGLAGVGRRVLKRTNRASSEVTDVVQPVAVS